jgi:RNA recognition motif-containing protein
MTFRDMLNSFITGEAMEGVKMPDMPAVIEAGPPSKAAEATVASGMQLWVENLPWDLSDEELGTYFATVGKLASCAVSRRRDGKSRGTAIVRYTNAADADRAIASLNGIEINGRDIRVRLDRMG